MSRGIYHTVREQKVVHEQLSRSIQCSNLTVWRLLGPPAIIFIPHEY